MTTSLALQSPVQPILTTLAAVRAARGGRLGVADNLVVEDPTGWSPATCFTDGTAMPALLAGPRDSWGATPHAAGALAWKAYTYWLTLPAVLGFAAVRRVPLLHAGNVLVRMSPDKPHVTVGMRRLAVAVLPNDPAAGQRGVRVVPDEDALLRLFRATLLDQHLGPLLTQLRYHARVGRRSLWGSLASGVAHAVARAAPALPADALASAGRMLDVLDVADLVDVERGAGGDLRVHRRTCCLAFTVECLKTCSSCCLPNAA
ncbi:ferric iron reductase [Longispora sp. K20-0274]|uniref:IucA/IucC family C-terminal-domain containing protein n=1 Tax=Longispora sp. K20-0274 TaxID=3088255 RepID=UPI00399A919C